MTGIHTILLVPAVSDPHGIMEVGPCCALPPRAHRYVWPNESMFPADRGKIQWRKGGVLSAEMALVLAWEGRVLDDGIAWAANRLPGEWADASWLWKVIAACLGILQGGSGEVDVLRRAAEDLPGTLVYLDGEGQEVTP